MTFHIHGVIAHPLIQKKKVSLRVSFSVMEKVRQPHLTILTFYLSCFYLLKDFPHIEGLTFVRCVCGPVRDALAQVGNR
jgi:hypothetical protein